jgi:hypothetical protein
MHRTWPKRPKVAALLISEGIELPGAASERQRDFVVAV